MLSNFSSSIAWILPLINMTKMMEAAIKPLPSGACDTTNATVNVSEKMMRCMILNRMLFYVLLDYVVLSYLVPYSTQYIDCDSKSGGGLKIKKMVGFNWWGIPIECSQNLHEKDV